MKNFLIIITLFFGITAFAQVGIGTTDPEGVLDLVSTDGGIVIPRVANTAAVVNQKNTATTTFPIPNGTMVYDESSSCIRAFEGGTWSACFSAGGATRSVRVTTTASLTDSDLNNVVISNTANMQYSLAGLNPSDGDTLTIMDAVGDGTTSFDNVTGAGLTGQTTLLSQGGGLTIIYDAETTEWYTISAF